GRADIGTAGCGESDIENAAGPGESGYRERGVRGRADIVKAGPGESGPLIANAGSGRADSVNAGSGESGYSECGVRGRADIVNGVRGERI
ncbi:unnamed protein product, partial [Staurois parvus]